MQVLGILLVIDEIKQQKIVLFLLLLLLYPKLISIDEVATPRTHQNLHCSHVEAYSLCNC